jgi:hypothetical protein
MFFILTKTSIKLLYAQHFSIQNDTQIFKHIILRAK